MRVNYTVLDADEREIAGAINVSLEFALSRITVWLRVGYSFTVVRIQ